MSDLLSVLEEFNCQGLLRIETVQQRDWAEFNIGEASVVVGNGPNGATLPLDFVPVAFAFSENEQGYRMHGVCGKEVRHTDEKKDVK